MHGLLVEVPSHEMGAVEPVGEGVEEHEELKLLGERLLLADVLSGLVATL